MSLALILWTTGLYVAAGLAEIGGGWLVWQAVRNERGIVVGLVGAGVLVIYGLIPTLQSGNNFGRIYAAYGGMFIMMAMLWGWLVDKQGPDGWDWLGGGVCLVGAAIIVFGPRS